LYYRLQCSHQSLGPGRSEKGAEPKLPHSQTLNPSQILKKVAVIVFMCFLITFGGCRGLITTLCTYIMSYPNTFCALNQSPEEGYQTLDCMWVFVEVVPQLFCFSLVDSVFYSAVPLYSREQNTFRMDANGAAENFFETEPFYKDYLFALRYPTILSGHGLALNRTHTISCGHLYSLASQVILKGCSYTASMPWSMQQRHARGAHSHAITFYLRKQGVGGCSKCIVRNAFAVATPYR